MSSVRFGDIPAIALPSVVDCGNFSDQKVRIFPLIIQTRIDQVADADPQPSYRSIIIINLKFHLLEFAAPESSGPVVINASTVHECVESIMVTNSHDPFPINQDGFSTNLTHAVALVRSNDPRIICIEFKTKSVITIDVPSGNIRLSNSTLQFLYLLSDSLFYMTSHSTNDELYRVDLNSKSLVSVYTAHAPGDFSYRRRRSFIPIIGNYFYSGKTIDGRAYIKVYLEKNISKHNWVKRTQTITRDMLPSYANRWIEVYRERRENRVTESLHISVDGHELQTHIDLLSYDLL